MLISFLMLSMEWNGGDEMEERRSICDYGRALKKYGSTSKHMTRNENLVKHVISKSDTLQGIALKYGVTTEQIRRANRLWASDSLFLREHLLIPVPADKNLTNFGSEDYPSTSQDSQDNDTIVSSPSSLSLSEDNVDVNNFLAKMDSSIANVKKEVKRAQGSSEFCGDGQDEYVQKRKAVARLRNSQHLTSDSYITHSDSALRPSSSGDVQSLPSAVVMTQGKRVKTSLQRLQQQQDEMFQL